MSEFYDLAETHTYSDWLLAAVADIGHDLHQEFYRASFPDLSAWIQRSKRSVKVREAAFLKLLDEDLLPLGEILKEKLLGAEFVDLGAGAWPRSVVPRLVAEAFLAKTYVAVDLHPELKNHSKKKSLLKNSKTKLKLVVQSLESFLHAVTPTKVRRLYFLAGMELKKPLSPERKKFQREFLSLLKKRIVKGDLILIGAGSPDLWVRAPDFRLRYSDNFHALFERR